MYTQLAANVSCRELTNMLVTNLKDELLTVVRQ